MRAATKQMAIKTAKQKDRAARQALIEAYREGLALTAIMVIGGGAALRIMVADRGAAAALGPGETVLQRFWCARASHAGYIVDAAKARRHGSDEQPPDAVARACSSVVAAAKRLGVALQSDEQLAAEALAAIVRLDREMQVQMRAGALKSVNRAYRQYRLDASARGDRISPYVQWLERYKVKMMREIGANLRRA